MKEHRRSSRSEARVATQNVEAYQVTVRVGLALAVLISIVAGLVRAG